MRVDVDLDAAIGANIITQRDALALRNFQAVRDGSSAATSEKFQIFGGFADVMAATGLAMILAAMVVFPFLILTEQTKDSASLISQADARPYFIYYAISTLSLSGFSNRLTFAAYPLVTTVFFIGLVFMGAACFAFMGVTLIDVTDRAAASIRYMSAAFVGANLLGLHFWRVSRFPLIPAALSGMWGFALASLANWYFDAGFYATLLGSGFAFLIWAIMWDMTDVRRETTRSQVAFWLHCCAGFLITNSVTRLVGFVDGQKVETIDHDAAGQIIYGTAFDHLTLSDLVTGDGAIMLFQLALAILLSLALDRRSLFTGACLPLIWVQTSQGLPIGTPFVGALLLSVTLAWQRWRTALLTWLPERIVAQLARTDLTYDYSRPTRQRFDDWLRAPQ